MLLAIALGLLVGTLNNELVVVDLLWFQAIYEFVDAFGLLFTLERKRFLH